MLIVLYCHFSGTAYLRATSRVLDRTPFGPATAILSKAVDKVGNQHAHFAVTAREGRTSEAVYQGVLDSRHAGRLFSTQSVDFIDLPGSETGRCFLASLDPTRPDDLEALVAELRRLLQGMRHGSVTLIVQDGRVVQLDATHKVRLAGVTAPRRSDQRS